jgi:chitodextrinase
VSRRAVLGTLLATGAGAAAYRTGAFSSVSMDRLSSVGVSSDEYGLLGIETAEPSGRDGDVVTVFTLTNRTDTRFETVTVTPQPTGTPLDLVDVTAPNSIAPGGTETVQATISCSGAASEVPVDMNISVSGDGVSVTATREVLVTCEADTTGPEITGVEWKGGGINPIASPEDAQITVDVWYYAGNGQPGHPGRGGGGPPGGGANDFGVECGVQTETNTNIRSDLPGQANTHIAVYIHESDESWHHPDFDPNTGEMDGWTNNADGVRWGDGSIGSAFDVACEGGSGAGPVAGDVYEIRQENWLDDREYIFEIVHDDVWSVEWDFGDGTTSNNYYVEHAYDADGTYDITLTAVIGGDEYTYTDTVDVELDEPQGDGPPAGDVYEIRQESWLGDREYIFEIVHGDVWDVEWNFGDGTTATNHWVRHTFSADGTYQIELTAVIDGVEYVYTDTVVVET